MAKSESIMAKWRQQWTKVSIMAKAAKILDESKINLKELKQTKTANFV